MIRLSICIATLNRAAFIGTMIDSILPQMTDAVELVVVDGEAPDELDGEPPRPAPVTRQSRGDQLDAEWGRARGDAADLRRDAGAGAFANGDLELHARQEQR